MYSQNMVQLITSVLISSAMKCLLKPAQKRHSFFTHKVTILSCSTADKGLIQSLSRLQYTNIWLTYLPAGSFKGIANPSVTQGHVSDVQIS